MHNSNSVLIILTIALLSRLTHSQSISSADNFKEESSQYDDCLKLLAKITLEAGELGLLIASHNYIRVIPLAVNLVKDIAKDIECFKSHSQEIQEQFRATSNCATQRLAEAKSILVSLVPASIFSRTVDYSRIGERISEVIQRTSECVNASAVDQNALKE